jgi:fucose permease
MVLCFIVIWGVKTMKMVSKLVQYIGFISVGLIANIIGPLLPAIRSEIDLTYSQGGLLLSGQFIGMLATSLIGGYLMDRFGKRPFMLAGSAMLLTGLIGSMSAMSFDLLYMFNLVTGFGYGIYEVGINALCADSSEENKGSEMNFVHFFYGIGAIAAPLLAFASTEYFGSWRYCFFLAMLAPAIVAVLLIMNKIDSPMALYNAEKQEAVGADNPYKSPFLWTAGFLVFFYVGVEVSTGGWISVYWSTLLPGSSVPASLTSTIFWLCLTIGRLFMGRLADRIGLSIYVLAASLGTLALSALWSFLPAGGWTLGIIGLLGLMCSGQFPTAMVVATAHFPGRSGVTAAFLVVFAGLSGFFIPTVIGWLADSFSIGVLSYSIMALSLLLAAFAYLLNKNSVQQ